MEITINTRISILVGKLTKTQSEFARKIGKPSQTISNIVNHGSKPGTEILEAIFKTFPNVSRDWLMMGEGEIFRNVSTVTNGVQISADSIPLMWTTLKDNYERTIEDLRYTVHLQREMLMGKQVSNECSQIESNIVILDMSEHKVAAYKEAM